MTSRLYLIAVLVMLNAVQIQADIISADNARAAGDYETAIAEYTSLAQAGNAVAQATLGYMLYMGEGIQQDHEAAVRWYRQAAQQGNADAQYNLAVAYAFGEGVEQNFIEAADWYARAAEQDHPIAQYSLGLSYSFGEGVEQDAENAAYWLARSAENGYVRAQVLLGSRYHTGNGVPLDYQQAARWYTLAAEQGDSIAQFNLGSMYRSGTGVGQDLIEARRWYQMSSQQGYEPATTELRNIDRTLASSVRNTQPQPARAIPSSPVVVEEASPVMSVVEEPVEEYSSSQMASEDPVTEIYPLEEASMPEPEVITSAADIAEHAAVAMVDESTGLLDMGALNASLPDTATQVTDELLTDNEDLSPEASSDNVQGNESRGGFFSRLFSRSRNSQATTETAAVPTEVPVTDLSVPSNAVLEPEPQVEDIPESIMNEEPVISEDPAPEIAVEEERSGGFFSRIFGGRSTTGETVVEAEMNETQVAAVEVEQEVVPDVDEAAPGEAGEIPEARQEPRSGGFFGRVFGRGGAAAEDTTSPETVAMVDDETIMQTTASQTAESNLNSVDSIYQQGLTEFERKNFGEAARHFQSAAAQGNLMAQYRLATLYYQGLGREQDYSQAALWYRRAAEQGNVDAQFSLGNMYLMGEGITQDDTQARYWYNQAAQQGHEAAQHNVNNLDRYSENNITITRDIAEEMIGIDDSLNMNMDGPMDMAFTESPQQPADSMVASVRPASNRETPTSLPAVDYERGLAYSFGEGVARDLTAAFEYFKMAAEKDYTPAQYKLGVAYAYAEGTSEDKAQAAYWYEKAAMKGHTIAQRNLGVMYENGDGVPEDKVKALAWYGVLAKSGNVMDIRRRDLLSAELSADEIAEAANLTNELQNQIGSATR